jgi:hypothetical protein
MNKLAAIYNVWDGTELLEYSINSVKNHVDLIIIVWQKISNQGEEYNPHHEILKVSTNITHMRLFHPELNKTGMENETEKRNIGLDIARSHNCTHFFHIDTDECYKDFGKLKADYFRKEELKPTTDGSVLRILTYFKKPIWSLEESDNYLVPFIHKLKPEITTGIHNTYPHYVDPTRRINASDVFQINGYMHHYSWVRKDIERKIRNSSAKQNIQRSKLLSDYNNPELGPGYFLKDYGQKLIEVPNYFNIEI